MYASGIEDTSGAICTDPIIFDVADSGTILGNNYNSPIPIYSCVSINYPAWYTFTAASSMAVEINTIGTFAESDLTASMGLFIGNCDNLNCLVGVGGFDPLNEARLKFMAIEGNEYILAVGNIYDYHEFQLHYISEEITNATACKYANTLQETPFKIYSGTASLFEYYDYSCSQAQENAVWFSYTALSYSRVIIS